MKHLFTILSVLLFLISFINAAKVKSRKIRPIQLQFNTNLVEKSVNCCKKTNLKANMGTKCDCDK